MKWCITINQKQAIDLGMTNVNQAVILGLISEAHTWAKPVIVDKEVYYWTARQAICKELPLLNMKPDTAYRHLKSLSEAGLIDYKKDGKKDIVRLTEKGKLYYVGNKSEFDADTMSEINPSKLGNKSENNSEINPTYPNTNTYPNTIDTYTEDERLNQDAFNMWLQYKGKKYSKQGKSLSRNFLVNYDKATQQEIVNNSIMNNYAGLFPPRNKKEKQVYQPVNGMTASQMRDLLAKEATNGLQNAISK